MGTQPAAGRRPAQYVQRLAAVVACLATVLLGATGVAPAAPAQAGSWTVTTNVDEDDVGACGSATTSGAGADGELSLREALCESRNDGLGTVVVPAGHYILTAGALVVDGGDGAVDVHVDGAGAGSTVVDANGSARVFDLDPAGAGAVDVSLSGLTVTGGLPTDGVGGGGILAGAPDAATRDSLTLTDCAISDNANDVSTTRSNAPGGGVQMSGGSLSVTRCTVSGNTAGSSAGGGVYFAAEADTDGLSVTDSTFVGNLVNNHSASGPGASPNGGGALAVVADVAGGAMTVADSAFTGNSVMGSGADADARGGAIYVQSGAPTITRSTFTGNSAAGSSGALGQGGAMYLAGAATVTYSRIVGNTATSAGQGAYHTGGGTVTATRDWWGCNAGPGNTGCDGTATGTGVLTTAPRLQLTTSASPATVAAGDTSTVTASFLTDSAAAAVPANQLTALVGRPVTWSASHGTLSDADSTLQSSGTAAATFTGVSGGVGSASAAVDAETQSAGITVNVAPAVTTQPDDQTVTAGDDVSFTTAASGLPAPTVQWQVSTDGGSSWSTVGGATDPTLTFTTSANQNGNRYRAVFTNIIGTATSDAAVLTVDSAPVVTTQPAHQTVTAGDGVSFTAAASGVPTPTVQWQVSVNGGASWSDVTGATATTLTFTAAANDNGNRYRAVFTNTIGTATSDAAVLTVNSAPVVTTQPTDQTVTAGDPVSFSAAASGLPAPTVQWQVSTDGGSSWSTVGGATATTLTFTTATDDNGNRYRAVFTNTIGTGTSDAAVLTVNSGPAVTTQPADQTVTAGDQVSFAAAASGFPAPTVQWQVSTDGGLLWSAVDGATTTTLTFTTTSDQNGNRYRAVFTNTIGTTTSDAAVLTVDSAPVVTAQPTDQTAPAGGDVSFSAAAAGFPGPTVLWQVSTDGGSSWSTVAGATATTLTFTTSGEENGNRYRAVFTNTAGSTATSAARLTVLSAPVVTSQPASQTAASGNAVTFTVALNSALPTTVQWQVSTDGGKTWTSITGATSPTLTFLASLADNGNLYRALLTNALGTTVSKPAMLRLAGAAAPSPTPTLPGTGTDVGARVALGLALLSTGCVLLIVGRRRRRRA